MSFARKKITVTITLGQGQFGDVQGPSIVLTDHRVQANITVYGGDSQGMLNLKIFGLSLDKMLQLMVIGPIQYQIRQGNKIEVAVGEEGSALSTIYIGAIDQAWGDFQSMPEVAFNITAWSAYQAAVKPVAATSYTTGWIDVVDIFTVLADKAGFTLDNSITLVKGQLYNPYFSGSALQQIQECAKAAGVNQLVDSGVLFVWPQGTYVPQGNLPVISPGAGLVGYPVFNENGALVTHEFIPSLRPFGQLAITKSQIHQVNGVWNVLAVNHNLESETPGGAWYTISTCTKELV